MIFLSACTGFQPDRIPCIFVKNLSGTPFYESKGSKDTSLLEESMPLLYERTQIGVSGPYIKDSVGF